MSGGEPEEPAQQERDMDVESEASDMEEVFDVDKLEEMEQAGMVQVVADDGELPPEDDGDGDEEMEGEEDVADMSLAVLKKHTKPVHAVAIHPGGLIVATGGEDDKAFLWRVNSCQKAEAPLEPFVELPGHTDTVVAVAFSADGSLCATGGMDGRVLLWDAETGEARASTEDLGDAVSYMFWHPKGNVVFAGGSDSQSAMWNEKGVCLQLFTGHASEVTCGALVGDNKLLATGSDDHSVKVFSPKTGECMVHFDNRGKGMHQLPAVPVTAVASHPKNPDCVIAGFEDGSVALLSVSSKKVLSTMAVHDGPVECIAPCPIMPYYVSCSAADGSLTVWNAENNTVRDQLKQDAGFVAVTWVGEHFYTADTQGTLKRYDGRTASTSPHQTWTGHTDTVLCISVHQDGWMVTGSDDHTARLFGPQ